MKLLKEALSVSDTLGAVIPIGGALKLVKQVLHTWFFHSFVGLIFTEHIISGRHCPMYEGKKKNTAPVKLTIWRARQMIDMASKNFKVC